MLFVVEHRRWDSLQAHVFDHPLGETIILLRIFFTLQIDFALCSQ